MKETEHESLDCPVHGKRLIMRRNPNGDGTFWACREHESEHCNITWSDTHRLWYGHPAHVAKSSKKRSRCTSRREFVIARLKACGIDEQSIFKILSKGLEHAEEVAWAYQHQDF